MNNLKKLFTFRDESQPADMGSCHRPGGTSPAAYAIDGCLGCGTCEYFFDIPDHGVGGLDLRCGDSGANNV